MSYGTDIPGMYRQVGVYTGTAARTVPAQVRVPVISLRQLFTSPDVPARAWSDALKVNAGSRLALNRYASLFASFDGEFANDGYSYGGRGGIRFSW